MSKPKLIVANFDDIVSADFRMFTGPQWQTLVFAPTEEAAGALKEVIKSTLKFPEAIDRKGKSGDLLKALKTVFPGASPFFNIDHALDDFLLKELQPHFDIVRVRDLKGAKEALVEVPENVAETGALEAKAALPRSGNSGQKIVQQGHGQGNFGPADPK